MKTIITIHDLEAYDAVNSVVHTDDSLYALVRPYGNCTLFNGIAKSDCMRLGNVAIQDGQLKVNLTLIS